MGKKLLAISMFLLLVLAWLWPAPDASAYAGSYTYRSTVLGANVAHRGGAVYEIVNAKEHFTIDESVFALTRIFNITKVDAFRIRHELYNRGGGLYRAEETPAYYPRRNWWAETYAYNDFGRLPSGDYEVRVLISIDGGGYQHRDTKYFNVSSGYNQPYYSDNYSYSDNYYYNAPSPHPAYTTPAGYNPPYYYSPPSYSGNYYNYDSNCNSNYYPRQIYSYSWTHIGTGVRRTGIYSYEIVNSRVNFNRDEDVHVLTKIANIEGIDRFRIKHEIYRSGGTHYRTNEAPIQYPGRSLWQYNYTAVNFNKIPAGDYEVRVYISIDGGRYASLGKKNFSVAGKTQDYWYDRDKCRYDWRYCDNRYRDDREEYYYGWTQFGTGYEKNSGDSYAIKNPKTTFFTNEKVIALTKISGIRGLDRFRVRHKLYKNNGSSLYRTLEGSEQQPNDGYWAVNYTKIDYGSLAADDYIVKVYISIDGNDYKYLDSKNFTVQGRYYNRDDNTDYRDYWARPNLDRYSYGNRPYYYGY